ncbi:hypothetical protein DY000_02038269 [Brassica cretica]|uniref:Uncharacterized protein n=1 Tax=Brassica cretica TaxID=69181 RepID=A0ABQ7BJN2_BRACR|nr:hypothetical protein DY000_02038269 [Brassica cretica]
MKLLVASSFLAYADSSFSSSCIDSILFCISCSSSGVDVVSIDATKCLSVDAGALLSIDLERFLSTESDVEWKVDVITLLLKSFLHGKMFCRFLAVERCPMEPIDRYKVSKRDIGKLNDQHDFQEEGSTSIDRFRRYRSMWLVVDPSCEWYPNLAVADQFSCLTSPRCF